MDNTYMYFAPAELDYRRQRATQSRRPRRRRATQAPWRRRNGSEPTT